MITLGYSRGIATRVIRIECILKSLDARLSIT